MILIMIVWDVNATVFLTAIILGQCLSRSEYQRDENVLPSGLWPSRGVGDRVKPLSYQVFVLTSYELHIYCPLACRL